MRRRFGLSAVIVTLLTALLPLSAHAVQPDEILPDAALESRARAISHGLRCLVCQNQSIDDSDAPLAKDLRMIVRERIKAGDDDKAVLDFVVARYGDFVLLKPPFNRSTLILWLSPLVLLLAGIWLGRRAMMAPAARYEKEAPLSAEERARLDEILSSKNDKA